MTKCVARDFKIELKDGKSEEWQDISHHVIGWRMDVKLGDLYRCQLTLVDTEIVQIEATPGQGQAHSVRWPGMRKATNDKIIVAGEDISAWIDGYQHVTQVGEFDEVVLSVQCDSNVLRINGCHPWKED